MKKLALFILVISLALSSVLSAAPAAVADDGFLRGVWVSSVSNLDYPSSPGLSAAELAAEADAVIDNCERLGLNAVFLQVRPCADALYRSKLFPSSRYLTGESSYDELPFDPLEYFVGRCHEKGIELHAWLNPYRVTALASEADSFCPACPAALHPEYLLKTDDGRLFFNPALPEVRALIIDGVREIIENYDVDGIHFDDYFYPDGGYDDSEAYAAYGGGQALDDWRRANVNELVRGVSELIRESSPDIRFGISPRGIWANGNENARGSATRGNGSYGSIYCDSLRFIEEGWVDYICPQIYWNMGNSAADYLILLPWWAEAVKGTGVKLYVGMADYRSAEAEDDPWKGSAELERQLDANAACPEVAGEVHFRYGSLTSSIDLINLYRRRYGGRGEPAGLTGEERLKAVLLRIMRELI